MTKMLKGFFKRRKLGEIAPHLNEMRLVSCPDLLPRVLLRVGQDRFGLIKEAVGVLQWGPQRHRGLQAFGEELVQLL